MKVSIDEDSCRGHGVCTTICPEVFVLNDDGYSEVQSHEVPAGLEDAVRRAAASCPEHAISAG
ncbi:MAG TPA: ferredoxin [Frankiaceae bacterium]|jgi:ferredoxin|nr:ferredoxin [Frankiaceae bacterium]